MGTLLAITDRMAWLPAERDASKGGGPTSRAAQTRQGGGSRGHRDGIRIVLTLTLGASLLLGAHGLHLRVNWTSSMPLGLYREAPCRLERGALVLICLPEEAARIGRQRRYLPLGDCPSGVSPIVKEIVAVAGDEIEMEEDFVSANGAIVDRTPLRATDTLGRPLPHTPLGRRVVSPGEVWVLGQNRERSWDSRYFGPIPISSVVGTARPLLTLDLRRR